MKHNIYHKGMFVAQIQFDRTEKCYISDSDRFYLENYPVLIIPFDKSYIILNGNKMFFEEQIIKPPLGLVPKMFYNDMCDKERFKDIKESVNRFFDHNKEIPKEWIEEYNELALKLKNPA